MRNSIHILLKKMFTHLTFSSNKMGNVCFSLIHPINYKTNISVRSSSGDVPPPIISSFFHPVTIQLHKLFYYKTKIDILFKLCLCLS